MESLDSMPASVTDFRPSTSGRAKRRPHTLAVETGINEQLKNKISVGLNEGLRYLASAQSAREAETEFDVFGKYVASELKSMNVVAARQLKYKLAMVLASGGMEVAQQQHSQLQFPLVLTVPESSQSVSQEVDLPVEQQSVGGVCKEKPVEILEFITINDVGNK